MCSTFTLLIRQRQVNSVRRRHSIPVRKQKMPNMAEGVMWSKGNLCKTYGGSSKAQK